MDRKKELIQEYKQRKITGGVFRVVNTRNGKYLLDYTPNIEAKQNAFNFTSAQGSCVDYKLRRDCETFGSQAFVFEVLATLVKKSEQTQEEFLDDLKALAQLWAEKMDASLRY